MSEHFEQLIIKALQGKILADEQYELEQWLADDEQNVKAYNELVAVWKQSAEGSEPPMIDLDAEWRRLRAATATPEVANKKNAVLIWSLRTAAAIALVLISTYLIQMSLFTKNRLITLTSTTDTLSVRLPDGSRITLNRNTKLTYYEAFKGNRSLELTGEAFFEVEKDKEHPFIVNTSAGTVRVLGTSFNVDATRVKEMRLTVVTGIVESHVKDEATSMRFTAGESGIISAFDNNIKKINTINATAWKDRILTFNDTPFADVAASIDKYFDQDIVIEEHLANCKVTAEFRNPTLDEVVGVLSEMLSLTVKRDGQHLMFGGEGCGTAQ